MILTDEEAKKVFESEHCRISADLAGILARAIEAAIIAKLGEPVAWRVFDGEGGYDYFGYVDNENIREDFIRRNPSPIYKNWVEPLYQLPEVKE